MSLKIDHSPDWLRSWDLCVNNCYGHLTLTINGVAGGVTLSSGEKITKPVLKFEETKKRLILCVMNQKLGAAQLGGSLLDWVGCRITFYPTMGDWRGQKNVTAIRVLVDEGKPRPYLDPENLGKDITGYRIKGDGPKLGDIEKW